MEEDKNKKNTKSEKMKFIAKSTGDLSLGISMVVATLLGLGLGLLMKDLTGIDELLFLGIFFGIAAAFLNVYKAYRSQIQEYEEEKD